MGGDPPPCFDAADVNDNGEVLISFDPDMSVEEIRSRLIELSDSIFLLNYVFLGGPAPNDPLLECGLDPTEDSLDCEQSLCGP